MSAATAGGELLLRAAGEALLAGGAVAIPVATAAAAALAATGRPAAIVLPDDRTARRMAAALAFFAGRERVVHLPLAPHAPYEGLPPPPDTAQGRVLAADALHAGDRWVVAAAPALLWRLLAPEALADLPVLAEGWRLPPEDLARRLGELGYLPTERPGEPGFFGRSGDRMELWPTGHAAPVRVEWFDDEVEALRVLDPHTRRPGRHLERLRVLPAHEAVLDAPALDRARAAPGPPGAAAAERLAEAIEDWQEGIRFPGTEELLPLIQPLAPPTRAGSMPWVLLDRPEVDRQLDGAWERIRRARASAEFPWLPLEARLAPPERVRADLARAGRVLPVAVAGTPALAVDATPLRRPEEGTLEGAVGRLRQELDAGWRVALVAAGRGRVEELAELLDPYGIPLEPFLDHRPERWPPGRAVACLGELPAGFALPTEGLRVVAASELLGAPRARHGPHRTAPRPEGLRTHATLREGDLVVHVLHGIGRYEGLVRLDPGSGPQDMVAIAYRGDDRLYLPVHKLDLVARYQAGEAGRPVRLDRLGSDAWIRRKARVRSAALELAHRLLQVQARRRARPGRAWPAGGPLQEALAASFPHEPTEDQARAIEAIREDLARPVPMDRLLVGDVAFGKTEVALRAAVQVIEGGGQVLVVAPTTVLAAQHARRFRERLAPLGIEVGLLSRFTEPAEARRLRRALASGDLPMVVGTTALLGRGIRPARPGLLVIDEEHRFGVRQKERLKERHPDVDVLALSATPIPRTLHMALAGLRDLSVLRTPPPGRKAITTVLARDADARIRGDLLRERARGGQAFFVHNRVRTLPLVARRLARLVPELRVGVAHGQMPGHELEEAMARFAAGETDVLLCTALVEAGLDLPRVNTMIVDRAHELGLAQLHQLRGRVGRGPVRAFCTLLVPDDERLRRREARRLRAVLEASDLGGGFAIAHADLDLRGVGDLLGSRQHGHVRAVGVDLWMDLLEQAMQEVAGEGSRPEVDPEVRLPVEASIPEDHVEDVEARLGWYRRLASAPSVAAARRVLDELERAHGEAPQPVLDLTRLVEVRIRCRELGIAELDWRKVRVVLRAAPHQDALLARMDALAGRWPRRFERRGETLAARFTPREAERPFWFLHWLLRLLEEGPPR